MPNGSVDVYTLRVTAVCFGGAYRRYVSLTKGYCRPIQLLSVCYLLKLSRHSASSVFSCEARGFAVREGLPSPKASLCTRTVLGGTGRIDWEYRHIVWHLSANNAPLLH